MAVRTFIRDHPLSKRVNGTRRCSKRIARAACERGSRSEPSFDSPSRSAVACARMSNSSSDKGRDGARGLTYRDAGVDIDAGDALVERIKPHVARTLRPEVIGGLGGFGGLFALPAVYREPVLVSGTDGVGTKL